MANAGVWNGQTKIRPGAYINFKAVRKANVSNADRGVVALPLALGWGPQNQVVEITAAEIADGTFTNKLGCTIDDPAVQPLIEAMKYASKALVYSLTAGGIEAKGTIGEDDNAMTITAKYTGTKGNDIMVSVNETATEDMYEVVTMLGAVTKDRQRIKNIEDLKSNDFVVFAGAGAPTVSAGVKLSGGTDETITVASMSNFLAAIKSKNWNTVALPLHGLDGKAFNATVGPYIKALRDAGKKVQAVVNNYPGANTEGVISVDQGYRTEEENVEVDSFVGTVAGMTAGAAVNQSNTYRVITGALEIINPKTDEEIEEGILSGCFILSYKQDGAVVVESDINTLVNVGVDKNDSFKKNRVIRTLDDIAMSIRSTFENSFIGKVTRNAAGKNALKASIVKYFTELQNLGAIQNFTAEDVEVLDGENIDAVVVNVSVQPLDSMEKLYMTVTVN
jgi:Mu-like prophage tail sheath protein gpL